MSFKETSNALALSSLKDYYKHSYEAKCKQVDDLLEMLRRIKEEINNAFEDLENKDLDALYGTLLEIKVNILP